MRILHPAGREVAWLLCQQKCQPQVRALSWALSWLLLGCLSVLAAAVRWTLRRRQRLGTQQRVKPCVIEHELLRMHCLPPTARLARHAVRVPACVERLRGLVGEHALEPGDKDHIGLAHAARRVEA
jgi:hypothetical protein